MFPFFVFLSILPTGGDSQRLSLLCFPFRSLFEKDKLLFAFLLSSKLMIDHHRMEPAELRFLLTGGVAMGDLPLPNPDPSWISDKMWSEMCRISDLGFK